MATHQKKHNKSNFTRELVFCSAADGQDYAEIIAPKGDTRFEVKLIRNNEVIPTAKACGSIISGPRKQRLNRGDIVMVQLDSSTSIKKYFIVHKYSPDDVKRLRRAGHLAQVKETVEDTTNVVFEGDVVSKHVTEHEIDDDFIADL